jgi:Arc/MetJ-type ribon-helix-helix transcriptional regulator
VDVATVRVDEKTRRELDQVVEELGGSTSEVIRKAIHLAWFTTMQDRMRRAPARARSTERGAARAPRPAVSPGASPVAAIAGEPKLLLFSRRGFTPELAAEVRSRPDVALIDLLRLYQGA